MTFVFDMSLLVISVCRVCVCRSCVSFVYGVRVRSLRVSFVCDFGLCFVFFCVSSCVTFFLCHSCVLLFVSFCLSFNVGCRSVSFYGSMFVSFCVCRCVWNRFCHCVYRLCVSFVCIVLCFA